MDSITGFVTQFSENIAQYTEIKKKLEISCREMLRGISFFWESRVKDPNSLREKLRNRQSKYPDESANIADIKDLVGGRIIFYNWQDLERIQNAITEAFNIKERSQLPKHAMDITQRFRGYSGLHFHIIWPHFLEKPRSDLVLEIQVMSPCMWWFSKMEHDVVYKEKNGPPSKRLRTLIEILKANVNQAEVVSQEIEQVQLEDINKRVCLGLEELEPQRQSAGFDFRAAGEKLVSGVTDQLLQQHSDYLARIADELLGSRRDQKEWRQSDKVSQCLQALFRPDCETQKQRNADRIEGTCQWFLKNEKYHSWIKSESSDLLWVTADAGCGKSVLAKSLIDDELRSRPSTVKAYFFFKDDNREQRGIANAMCALLHQILVQSDPKLQELAAEAYSKSGPRLAESYTALWDLLLQLSQEPEAGEIVCILDALDECEKSGQDLLINSLNEFCVRPKNYYGRLKILVTSRPYQSIRNRFDSQSIRVAGEDNSDLIKQEIDLVIKHRVPQVASRLNLDTRVQDLLQHKLLEAENRTYLWIHLILEDIVERGARVNTARKMERFLIELPTSIYTAYDHMLKRSPKPDDAKKLLHIMLAAVRPLNLREMNMAFNIQDGDKSREDVDLDPEEKFATTIRDTCGLFVTVSNVDSTIYLIHQTAREFLISLEDASQSPGKSHQVHGTWKHSMRLEDSNHLLTQICFRYLSFSVFEMEPPWLQADAEHHGFRKSRDDRIRVDTNKHELLDYAAKHWHDHYRLAWNRPRQTEVWLDLCSINKWTFKLWFDMYLDTWCSCNSKHQIGNGITPLMLASMFGHVTMVESLANENDLERKDSCGRTALWWAARKNHPHVLGQLLDKGAMADSGDNHNEGPLSNAARFGDLAMMQSLIDHGALPDGMPGSQSRESIPLHAAIRGSQEESIARLKILISNCANIHLKDSRYRTALIVATEDKKYDVARWLVSKGAMDQIFPREVINQAFFRGVINQSFSSELIDQTLLRDIIAQPFSSGDTDRIFSTGFINQTFSRDFGNRILPRGGNDSIFSRGAMDLIYCREFMNQRSWDEGPLFLSVVLFKRLYDCASGHGGSGDPFIREGAEYIMDKLIDTIGGRACMEHLISLTYSDRFLMIILYD